MELKIQRFLLQLPAGKQQCASLVRDLVLDAMPEIKETIKWKQLTFVSGKTNIAFIYTYAGADYINLGFFKATALSDPKKLFKGTGKGMRHIKIKTAKDIPAVQIKKWVREAALLAE